MDKITFTCHYQNKEASKEWIASIMRIGIKTNCATITVEGNGSIFDVIVGRNEKTNWICIPQQKISSELSDLKDKFWNQEALSKLLPICDAIMISNMLAN
ncbi:MAG: hypothetical protein RR705_09685, partial [Lachnospiraceae bacterium]